ncbi:MAG: 2,3,4,5-tetrahydropyridine-2,6-dicarboxylate N-succinyltransferase, partial [Gammaproteobacteria bacterium]|nr:2,3,4,5-tetrahydropyridine-2,6-dicarboxylate N-succinyltransferase [Gammaproteobacteria bacterium]
MSELQSIIEAAFENRAQITPANVEPAVKNAVLEVIELIDSGEVRVAEPVENGWQVNEWIKKAVLLSFRIRDNQIMAGGSTQYYDKV